MALHLFVEGAAWQLQQVHHVTDIAFALLQGVMQALRLEGFHLAQLVGAPAARMHAALLDRLGVAHETKIVSAHRTPKRLYDYAQSARTRGLKVIIAGAGGAAHLPGMAASMTTLPVLGVPVETKSLQGMDSLLSIVQMPAGVPVGTLAIGKAGAINAALLAASILATSDSGLADRLEQHRSEQTASVAETPE